MPEQNEFSDAPADSSHNGSRVTEERAEGALRIRSLLGGRRLLVFGGTGFLGKVWLALVLTRVPEIDQIFLVVRPKAGQAARERFFDSVLTSEVFAPLREAHGEGFTAFVASKVTPIPGDVTLPFGGIDEELRKSERGRIAAVVNVAGLVDFDPPLDEALQVNALGSQHLVELCRDLGGAPLLHTSTCFTAGGRTGVIEELDPRQIPYPSFDPASPRDFDPRREIEESARAVEEARARFGSPTFEAELRGQLERRPPRSYELDKSEAERLAEWRKKTERKALAAIGMERARSWGWPNTYTYTKSLGEQVIASSGLPFSIVRPAIVESTLSFPFPGWNEGINTSSPFIFLIRQGGLQIPGSQNNLDLIPCDLVCVALVLALAELVEGRAKPVYQAAASDLNPCTMARFFELSGLHKRRLYREGKRGGRVASELQRRFESVLLSKSQYESYGPRRLAWGADRIGGLVRSVGRGPLARALAPAVRVVEGFAEQQRKLARVMDTFLPFVAEYHYVFRTDAVRAAFARLTEEEKALFPWHPEDIDWRQWFLEIHAPALERYVFPEMEARLRRARPAKKTRTEDALGDPSGSR